MLITRLYSFASSRGRLAFATALATLALGGCGWIDRVFDPVGEPGRVVSVSPKFSTLNPGQTLVLEAAIASESDPDAEFSFSEDSGRQVVRLDVQDGRHVVVNAIGPGQAIVTAKNDDDEGIAIVTVVDPS